MAENFYDVKNQKGGKTSAGIPYSDFSNGEFAFRWWEKEKDRAVRWALERWPRWALVDRCCLGLSGSAERWA